MSSADQASLTGQVNTLTHGDPSQASPPQASSELVAEVDEMLNQLSSKFGTMSSELIAKIDEMSRRLDLLETAIQVSAAAMQAKDNA